MVYPPVSDGPVSIGPDTPHDPRVEVSVSHPEVDFGNEEAQGAPTVRSDTETEEK